MTLETGKYGQHVKFPSSEKRGMVNILGGIALETKDAALRS